MSELVTKINLWRNCNRLINVNYLLTLALEYLKVTCYIMARKLTVYSKRTKKIENEKYKKKEKKWVEKPNDCL